MIPLLICFSDIVTKKNLHLCVLMTQQMLNATNLIPNSLKTKLICFASLVIHVKFYTCLKRLVVHFVYITKSVLWLHTFYKC